MEKDNTLSQKQFKDKGSKFEKTKRVSPFVCTQKNPSPSHYFSGVKLAKPTKEMSPYLSINGRKKSKK
jgi:hypothetical protein